MYLQTNLKIHFYIINKLGIDEEEKIKNKNDSNGLYQYFFLFKFFVDCRFHSVQAISRYGKFNDGGISQTTVNPQGQVTIYAY